MLFTSLEFLLFFFPTVFIVNFLLPHRAKNIFLTLASLFFYAWGEPRFLFVMLASILFNYLVALPIGRSSHPIVRRGCLIFSIVGNLSLLFVFKYANFATSLIQRFIPSVYVTRLALPIGISFFTFQAMSYVIDVYRGTRVQKNPISLALYISLFPQLIAGPIVRYTDVEREICERHVTWEDVYVGFSRFLRGFNKKMLLANAMAVVADAAFASTSASVLLAWLGAVSYAFQIFFDFSGYSDMAIGLGRLFGFRFPENFDLPYVSKTVTEFWRRWHMTLGGWFRDYLYFPLGGSRVSSRRLAFNLFLVWGATGLWHGADFTFLLWGLLYGTVILFEKIFSIPKKAEENRLVGGACRVGTLTLVLFGWVLFRAEGLLQAGEYMGTMLGMTGAPVISEATLFYASEFFVIFVFCVLCSTPAFLLWKRAVAGASPRKRACIALCSDTVQLLLFAVSLSMVATDLHNPFIYFNF